MPLVVATREAVQQVAPRRELAPLRDPAVEVATRLIVRWEISSPAYYSRRLEGVICPGGASGPTWGLGWDGGHQTPTVNRTAWADHPAVDRLAETSGKTGSRCKPALPPLVDIRTPYAYAEAVFQRHGLPRYAALAERKYGSGINDLSPGARGSLWSETYNRGGHISSSHRGIEQARIRDVCIPARDERCIATELRKMCRIWAGTSLEKGLCARREDEARTAES